MSSITTIGLLYHHAASLAAEVFNILERDTIITYSLSLLLTGIIFLLPLVILGSFLDSFMPNCTRVFFAVLTWQPVIYGIFLGLGFCSPFRIFLLYLRGDLASQPYLFAFLALLSFKAVKIVVHTVSYWFLSRPARLPILPTWFPSDVTVIVPTVGDLDAEFEDCIQSILKNSPARIIISTVGAEKLNKARDVCQKINATKIMVVAINQPNKRAQVIHAANIVETHITCYADDHVFWPSTYLRSALAPFEDPIVGLVGTVKQVLRDRSGGLWKSLMNYIACIYLERHNFECTATYNIDGGVFVISGRTALIRTDIIQSMEYRVGFLNETWAWGTVGPMKVDDDNFTTRFMVNHGYKTVFHNHEEAMMKTTLGTTGGWPKFRGQLIRWVRTTWRSNSTSLFAERVCWKAYPWTTYAMFISSFVNFALFYDPLLVYTLWQSGHRESLPHLLLFLLVSKLIKPLEHLCRHPRDIVLLPLGILFGYFHSLFKLWAMLTAYNIGWTGRTGIDPVQK